MIIWPAFQERDSQADHRAGRSTWREDLRPRLRRTGPGWYTGAWGGGGCA